MLGAWRAIYLMLNSSDAAKNGGEEGGLMTVHGFTAYISFISGLKIVMVRNGC